MGEGSDRTWQAVAAANRERIRALEREMLRTRENVHSLRSEVGALRYLGDRLGEQSEALRGLADRVERLSRQALHRPTQTGLSVLAQYLALIVALLALALTLGR